MKYFTIIIVVFALIFNSCNNKPAEKIAENIAVEQSFKYKVETIVPDLEQPWGMAFLPDGSMLITEKKGVLIHFKNGKKTNYGFGFGTGKDFYDNYFYGHNGGYVGSRSTLRIYPKNNLVFVHL